MSGKHVLCEINYGNFLSIANTIFYYFGGLEFGFLANFSPKNFANSPISKFRTFETAKTVDFCDCDFTKIDSTKNLHCRKITECPNCVLGTRV